MNKIFIINKIMPHVELTGKYREIYDKINNINIDLKNTQNIDNLLSLTNDVKENLEKIKEDTIRLMK